MRFMIALATFAAAVAFAPRAPACPTHEVTAPTSAGKGGPREVKELLDTPFVRLVSITLRNGTTLPKHATKEAITVQALSGTGTLRIGEKIDRLGPGQVVLVIPGAEHEIVPDGKKDLVLLVHFLKNAGEGGGEHAHHDHPAHAH
jgi:quercetin dioxygenase-like cupin family protein